MQQMAPLHTFRCNDRISLWTQIMRPSGCGVSQCAGTTFRQRRTSRTLSDRAPSGSAFRSIRPGSGGGRRRASSVVTHLPASTIDHADRATLGRRRRTRRPGLMDGWTVAPAQRPRSHPAGGTPAPQWRSLSRLHRPPPRSTKNAGPVGPALKLIESSD